MDDHVAVALARRSASPGGRRGHAMRSLRRPYCLFQEHDEQSGVYGRGAEGNNRDGSQTMRVNARLAAAQVGSSDAQAHGAAFFFRGPSEQCGTGRVGGRGKFNFRPPALNAPLCPASEPLARAGLFLTSDDGGAMHRMTTMERAFHLARSGRFTTIAEVLTALDREGIFRQSNSRSASKTTIDWFNQSRPSRAARQRPLARRPGQLSPRVGSPRRGALRLSAAP
jgi:hypothetical protein